MSWKDNFPKENRYFETDNGILYCGDCLEVMESLHKGIIRLIYIDPPYGIKKDEVFGLPKWKSTEEHYKFCEKIGLSIIRKIDKRKKSNYGMAHYLNYIYKRLVLMRELLAETGSIYVHCDWHINSYIRVMMDEIFGREHFRNEIIWAYRTGGSSKEYWSRKHDTILFYTKSENYVFNTQKEKAYTKAKSRKPGVVNYGAGTAEFFEDEFGVYNWVIARDVWDIPYINSQALERLDFPTQKPEALLERIIKASSNEGDLVADFFCGSGTTLAVAERLGRRWIGIEINPEYCEIAKQRILNLKGDKE